MRHIIPISGKDSLCTALVQLEKAPHLQYEFMYNQTGTELPETLRWLDLVEQYLGVKIVRVGSDLEEIIEDHGYFLPGRNARYCTKEAKIWPMEKYIGKEAATVYYGIRADENRTGYSSVRGNITANYPLIEAGYTLQDVYLRIGKEGLKPPSFFWESLYNAVCERLGYIPVLSEYLYDTLFAWRSRANCYFCYNQRKYEWVGLLEHYPDLFAKAESMEHLGSKGVYSWGDIPLSEIAKNADQIKEKRVNAVLRAIRLRQQLSFDFQGNHEADVLATATCGLFCAK